MNLNLVEEQMDEPFFYMDASSFSISASETKPIVGYEIPVNETTGEKFPNCCKFHKGVFDDAKIWFDKFPNCCDAHRKLLQADWFDKTKFKDIPNKIVTQLSYTEHHIRKRIKTPEWYRDITNYLEYNFSSFGQLPLGYGNPVGLHIYYNNIISWIKNAKGENTNVAEEKKQKLLEFIEEYHTPPKDVPKTDLNLLFATYQKWLRVFPFEISYFKNLKSHFKTRLPFAVGKAHLNPYTGLTKVKMQTQSGLIDSLVILTIELLEKINSAELLNKGIISNLDKHRLELENESLKVDTAKIVGQYSKSELKYIKTLKKWLARHKKYFKDISPLINKDYPNEVNDVKEKQSKDIEKLIHYYNETKWCIPFRELHNTVTTVCNFIKPIQANFDSIKYIKYFFRNIDFDKIDLDEYDDNHPTKKEILSYCNSIHYGLELILKKDVQEYIFDYQKNISQLSKEQIAKTQIKLIELIGSLKLQTRTVKPGLSFTQQYLAICPEIKKRDGLNSIDYQSLIFLFNETILSDLLSSYEIINETFNRINHLPNNSTPQETETKTESKEVGTDFLAKLNIDKYIDWVLTKKAIVRDEKKKMALSLLDGREKNIANYRFAIKEIFIKNKYWKEPTPDEREFFKDWRQQSFEVEQRFFEFKSEGSALPITEIKKQVCESISHKLNSLYTNLIDEILGGVLTENYYGLANVAGKIDYLKILHGNFDEVVTPKLDEKKSEHPQIKKIKNDISQPSFKLKPEIKKKVEFKDILDVLKNGNFIRVEITLPIFKKIFSGDEVQNKIEWVGSISSLHVFISEMWKFQTNQSGKWKTTCNCFFHANELSEEKLKNNKVAKSEDKEIISKAIKHFTAT